MSDVTVSATGAIFDGRAAKEMQRAADEWTATLAKTGAADIRAIQNVTFKTQTPFYRVHTEAKADPPGWKIWDQGVVYGPWLEGTGSRNKTTRFKGYMIFRRAVQRISQRAVNIGQPIIARYMGRMN
jgi:hypothetical protein